MCVAQPHLPDSSAAAVADDADDGVRAVVEADADVDVHMYLDMMKCVTDYVLAREPWSMVDQEEAYRMTYHMARDYVHTMRFAITRCAEPSPDALRALDDKIGLWRATICETWSHALCSLLTLIVALPDDADDPTTWSVHTRVGLVRAWLAEFTPPLSTP